MRSEAEGRLNSLVERAWDDREWEINGHISDVNFSRHTVVGNLCLVTKVIQSEPWVGGPHLVQRIEHKHTIRIDHPLRPVYWGVREGVCE